jgi:hypothetical protein
VEILYYNLDVVDRATDDIGHCTQREIRHHTQTFLQQEEERLDDTFGMQSFGSRLGRCSNKIRAQEGLERYCYIKNGE